MHWAPRYDYLSIASIDRELIRHGFLRVAESAMGSPFEIPPPPVGPENEVWLGGAPGPLWHDVQIGTSCRDCHSLKPNGWFSGAWLGRFRRWRYRAEMCACGQIRATRTLSSVTAGLSWPKPTGTGEARG